MKMHWLRAQVALLALLFAGAALAQRDLPDFVKLVEDQGPAVVNISTTQAARRVAAIPQIPGAEDEEVQEFFRRFIPRQPGPQQGPQQGPRPESRSLGSGFITSADAYVSTIAQVLEGAIDITTKLTANAGSRAKVIGTDNATD